MVMYAKVELLFFIEGGNVFPLLFGIIKNALIRIDAPILPDFRGGNFFPHRIKPTFGEIN